MAENTHNSSQSHHTQKTSMAENNGFLFQLNQTIHSFHTTTNSHQTLFQELTPDRFAMERGPKYNEYSALRNKRLKTKNSNNQQNPEKETLFRSILTPVTPPLKKQVKFEYSNFTTPPKRPKSRSVLTQSVPDFSSALRKENRKPSKAVMPSLVERCVIPPVGMLKGGKLGSGSKSTIALEKKNAGMMVRTSFASVVELKRLGCDAGNAINGGGKIGKTVLRNRRF